MLGLGLVTASRASSLGQFQLVFGVVVGVAAGSFFAPLVEVLLPDDGIGRPLQG